MGVGEGWVEWGVLWGGERPFVQPRVFVCARVSHRMGCMGTQTCTDVCACVIMYVGDQVIDGADGSVCATLNPKPLRLDPTQRVAALCYGKIGGSGARNGGRAYGGDGRDGGGEIWGRQVDQGESGGRGRLNSPCCRLRLRRARPLLHGCPPPTPPRPPRPAPGSRPQTKPSPRLSRSKG